MILAAVSGGLDSVAMLWRLLEARESVQVLHVSLRSNTGRWRPEDAAMAALVPAISAIQGSFEYAAVPVRARGLDIVMVSALAGELARRREWPVDGLARGSQAHDMASLHLAAARRQADAEWATWWDGAPPPVLYPIAEMRRADLWSLLPEHIRRITWSCRMPVFGTDGAVTQCGACDTCREMAGEGVPLERDIVLPHRLRLEEERMQPRKEVVSVTTDGSGDATAYSPAITGRIQSIAYVKTDFADGVDFTITSEDTGQNIWTETDVNASTQRAPRQPVHGQDGTASLYAGEGEPVEDTIALVDERVKIVIAQGGATKTGAFHITYI